MKNCYCCLVAKSCPTLCDPWTITCQAPLSMGFPRQEYWNGLLFPSPGDLPDPGIKPGSLALQADSLPSEPAGNPEPLTIESKHTRVKEKQVGIIRNSGRTHAYQLN